MSVKIDGSTALVTGASSGMGMAMARELASRVATLILVARRKDRLEALRSELQAEHARLAVHVESCDLSDLGATRELAERLSARFQVDVLINNAGAGSFGLYDRSNWEHTERLIALNVTSLALLTRAFVPGMVARGRGGVLNLSSGWGVTFAPGFAAYAGSKHFVSAFTEALRLDLKGTGVSATQACPGPVLTEFERSLENTTTLAVPEGVGLSAERAAREILRGFERGQAMVIPGLGMRALLALARITPRPVLRLIYSPVGPMIRRRQALASQGPA
jgi:short-subunit dehydrogenase